ncbi:DUF1003 domain-containing protein [Patescibacteria group bacterium]|nr:DUF1003 domain-containing protein [Patescibacteria group bacterium]
MSDKVSSDQHKHSDLFFPKAAIILVRIFGSWASIAIHTLIFLGWFFFNLNLEQLLVIVSIEAIYFCIFILMAENIETAQRDNQQEANRQKDMRVIRQDARVDEKSLKELGLIKKQLDTLYNAIQERKI